MRKTRIFIGLFFIISIWGAPGPLFSMEGKKILIFRKEGPTFEEVSQKLKSELKGYTTLEFIVKEETSFEEFEKKIQQERPQLLVLMDNKPLQFGIRFNGTGKNIVPGIALMALNLQHLLKDKKGLAGIAFETPGYTIITQFRYYSNRPIKNVLVFYRKGPFSDIVEQAKAQLKKEKIEVTAIDVEQTGKEKEKIGQFVKSQVPLMLSQSESYDALWCLLDSSILTHDLFNEVWIPGARSSKIPVVTGIESLADPKMDFAAFAVTPNVQDLAGQAAQMIEKVLEENESIDNIGVEQIISVNKVINSKKFGQLGIKLEEGRVSDAKILE